MNSVPRAARFIRNLPNGDRRIVDDRGVRLARGAEAAAPHRLQLGVLNLSSGAWRLRDRGPSTAVCRPPTLSAQRLSTVKNADRVYVLDQGRVIESGTYHELRHREEGAFREMVEMQSL
jgi:hypothetical protein